MPSFLPVIAVADNFRVLEANERLVPWTLTSTSFNALGLLRPQIVDLLRADNDNRAGSGLPPSWIFGLDGDRVTRVSLGPHLDSASGRSAIMRKLCEGWRDIGLFPEVIGPRKWRSELYALYSDPFGPHLISGLVGEDVDAEDELARTCSNYLFSMERTACALFGVVTFGVHMNVYEVEDGKTLFWVPRRSKTKQT
jgi:hypothetical protein